MSQTTDLTGKRVRFTRDVYGAGARVVARQGEQGTVVSHGAGGPDFYELMLRMDSGAGCGADADEIEVIE